MYVLCMYVYVYISIYMYIRIYCISHGKTTAMMMNIVILDACPFSLTSGFLVLACSDGVVFSSDLISTSVGRRYHPNISRGYRTWACKICFPMEHVLPSGNLT